ncbi:MAG: glycosyltransferase [Lachnospiraceae bacterium]|nr:glycosyltransferase [Lachnospiraceae bacterium]
MNNDKPILLFRGDPDVCYGILRLFSDELYAALSEQGEEVIYHDAKNESPEKYAGNEYKAIVGFMDMIFLNKEVGLKEHLLDRIYGPKIEYWPDHPAVFYRTFHCRPGDYHILAPDNNYVSYINRYYHGVRAFYFPPAGCIKGKLKPFSEREYGISFVGTYDDWHKSLVIMENVDDQTYAIEKKYLDVLVSCPELTAEDALEEIMNEMGLKFSETEFVQAMSQLQRLASAGVSKFYRQEMIQHLLDRGLDIDVFGDSWREAPFADHRLLHIHPKVSADRMEDIYLNSRISLNMMTWHKDAITERVLDSMLAGCIAVSDETAALKQGFIYNDGENDDIAELLLYSLKDLESLPGILQNHMDDEALAARGREKALKYHTWKNRAKLLLEIIDEINRGG